MGSTRPLAAVAAATLIAGVTGLTAPAGAAPGEGPSTYDPKPAASGASWLTGQLTKGLVHNDQYDFDDVGLSIDVALGLDGAGKKPTAVKTITKAVAKNVGSYTSFAPSVYAGPTAKAAVLAQTAGKNPESFGGVDLVAQLEGLVGTAAPVSGRIQDAYDPSDPFGGDFANVIGQAYAAKALTAAGSPKAAAVTAFLLAQQCDKGYFRQYFTTDKTRPDQSCQGAPRAERGASTDATALAVLALQGVKGHAAAVAVDNATDWLVEHQQAGGGFTDTGKAGAVNANSTGLAGWAFGETGASTYASKAAVVVRGLQVEGAAPCTGKLGKDAGAIALDAGAYSSGPQKGITKKTRDQWRRASAQALPVLRWAPRGDGDVTATAPSRVAAGSTFTVRLTGAAAGQHACVVNAGTVAEYVPGRNALTRLTVYVPQGTVGVRTYAVWVGGVRRDLVVRVTG